MCDFGHCSLLQDLIVLMWFGIGCCHCDCGHFLGFGWCILWCVEFVCSLMLIMMRCVVAAGVHSSLAEDLIMAYLFSISRLPE